MNNETSAENFFKTNVLGHPAGLFVLFFTEMWERFSFYGMRVLLVNFLTMAVVGVDMPGWGWSSENAGALFSTYAALLYLTPILGGMIADKFMGYRNAVILGCLIMTLGHACMALETEFSIYGGLALLVIGTGFFKPNITSVISELYKKHPEKKDGAYTIFYMGVNAGAFFGMMLCGYLAERVGWSYGFGLAGIFMLFGTLQFWLAKPLFGTVGDPPKRENKKEVEETVEMDAALKRNPFTFFDKILIVITSVFGLLYIFNNPLSKVGDIHILPQEFLVSKDFLSGPVVIILLTLILFLVLVISRIVRYEAIIRDRMIAFVIFAFFTVFFWLSFEQGATSLIIFARDFTDRVLEGSALTIFNVVNSLLTVIPLALVTWVLVLLFKQTKHKILGSNIVLFLCFGFMWGIALWMLYNEFTKEVSEVTVSWFSILNSFFIIVFASLFTKWWDSKYNPPASIKYGLGLIIMGLGFAVLAYGTKDIPQGAEAGMVRVSMIWLIIAYLFHTLGELCLSPVGLSYVSKLVPARMIAFMFGMWYLAIAIGNNLAATLGGMIDSVVEEYNMSTFFLIFTIIPVVAGLIIFLLNPVLRKLMHGIK